MDIVRPPRKQVAEVVQHTSVGSVAETGFSAMRTGTLPKVAAAMQDLRLGKVFGACDAFRDIREILSWSRHGKALLGHALLAKNLRYLPDGVTVSFHVTML